MGKGRGKEEGRKGKKERANKEREKSSPMHLFNTTLTTDFQKLALSLRRAQRVNVNVHVGGFDQLGASERAPSSVRINHHGDVA